MKAAQLPATTLIGCSDLVKARSFLLSRALGTDAEVFLFIDADMLPSVDQLETLMLSERVDSQSAVTGAYLSKGQTLCARPVDGQDEAIVIGGMDRYRECQGAGLGFAAVHRSSVLRYRATLPVLRESGVDWWPFFLPTLISAEQEPGGRRYLAEDYAFWWNLRAAAGVRLWLDTHLSIGHLTAVPVALEVGDEVEVAI
ncbi:MAG: hypothetical protein SFV15_18975 [Polyangiaceae bacterium]|nr:hypothetical protein [Polyangiaceae bacterium]